MADCAALDLLKLVDIISNDASKESICVFRLDRHCAREQERAEALVNIGSTPKSATMYDDARFESIAAFASWHRAC